MKSITLLRHAKSSWDDAVPRDFDRPLNDKGKKAGRTVGAYLKGETIGFDHIIASPAVRVIETLDAVQGSYGQPLKPNWDRRVYLASCVTLLDILRELPAQAERVLLVGHNPGLEDLVLMLVPDQPNTLREALEEKFPTASLAVLEFDGSWPELAPGKVRLSRFVRPRDLDPTLGPDQD